MAPPPPTTLPLSQRVQRLATTLQFGWFIGHAALLSAVTRYGLSYITMNYYSGWAQFSYRLAFISAVATYGIVVFKGYRAKLQKPGAKPQQLALMLLADENVQYLLISLVWLSSRQVPLALLPFTVYSVFHVATYTRTNILPTISPPKVVPTTTPASPSTPKSQTPLASSIGKFVKEYYDASMMLVAGLEIALWFRLLLSAFTFTKGAWILLGIYTVFLRARYQQSHFVQNAFAQGAARVDQQVQSPSIPPAVRQGWESAKSVGKRAVDATDARRYMGGATATAQKKPQ